jgi:Transposase DDE domain
MDPESFLIELYVLADEFAKTRVPPESRPGPAPALACSEVLTLAVFSQWARFGSERDFWRYAQTRLHSYFPRLPSRPQFNRQLRRQHAALSAFALWLAARLDAAAAPYEAVDGTAVPTRNAKRRGLGWLPGVADIGKCLRRGWIEGLRLLVCTTPQGTVTGWGVGPASANDRALAETLLTQRRQPPPVLVSAGTTASNVYVADSGFAGAAYETRLQHEVHAQIVAPPQTGSRHRWSWTERRWVAGRRQIVETVIGRLEGAFRLERERPHELGGFLARLAAKMALHNGCLWLNRQRGQPLLALVELFGW